MVKLAELPVDAVLELAAKLGPFPSHETTAETVEQTSGRTKLPEETVYRACLVLTYLIRRARASGVAPAEVVPTINGILELAGESSRIPGGIADSFRYTPDERREALAREAFAVPPTYLSSELVPALLLSPRTLPNS